MTNTFEWPEPHWLADLPDVERQQAKTRFLLCIAQAYFGDKASIGDFCTALNLPHNHLSVMKSRGSVSGETAVQIERLLGREHFPRELFRPDLFIIAE